MYSSKTKLSNMPIYFTKLNGDVREVEYVPTRTILDIINELSRDNEFDLHHAGVFIELHHDRQKYIIYKAHKWLLLKFGRSLIEPNIWSSHRDETIEELGIGDGNIVQIIYRSSAIEV